SAARYFQDVVLKEAREILEAGKEDNRSGGNAIHTTWDINLQSRLQSDVEATVRSGSDIETGPITINTNDDAVHALIGGRNYDASRFNRSTQAKRMAGSTFKPFLYYAALTHGYTPSTKLKSEPTTFELSNGQAYSPSNFNGYYANEPITLATAL